MKNLTVLEMMQIIAEITETPEANVYGGKLDAKKEKTLGVYPRSSASTQCIGGTAATETRTAAFSVLIHWNGSYAETETEGEKVYQAIADLQNGFKFGDITAEKLFLETDGAVDIFRDENGIWERVIEFTVHYYCAA